ncbi:MAG TPA: winged helix-turn-helix domain-containing protein [Caulobacteraceae bacterium]|jgi:TolB-like protein
MSVEHPARTIDLAQEASFALGALEVRPSTREVIADGRSETLEPRVMQVLVMLAGRRGHVVSRDDLIARCWGGRVVSEDAINRCIHAIRQLADQHHDFSVTTVARVGYRLDADSRPGTTVANERPTLAVLAFDNHSGDPALDYFCDGVSDEIQQTVAQGTTLKVVARSSSFQFRGAEKAVDAVSMALGCTHLLDGSVRLGGARVRIAAELVECASGATLWASRFDGELGDIFSLQETIAEAVAQALKITLAAPSHASVLDPDIYQLFLRARSVLAEGSFQFDDSAFQATPLLEQVTLAAPNHASAWELLASARAAALRSRIFEGDFEEMRVRAREAAHLALQLDPKRGGAYAALAMLEPWGAYLARERLLSRALEVAPRDPAILTEMSTFCWAVGRFHEALRLAEQASELNPLMPSALLQVAMMRTYVGDYETSIRMHQELHRRWPGHAGILLSLLNIAATLGFWDAYDAAADAVEAFEGWQGRDLRATLAFAEAVRSKDPAIHAKRLRRYSELLERTGTLALNLIEGISQMGMVDKAFELAEDARFAHIFDPKGAAPSGYFPGTVLGRWSALNREPRFIALCDRLGLCSYWTQSGHWPDCADWAPYDFKSEVRRQVGAQPRP